MYSTPQDRKRTVKVVSLSKPESAPSSLTKENNLSKDITKLLSNLRDVLLQRKSNANEIDLNIFEYIQSINTKIQELPNITQPTDRFDIVLATLKTYINDILGHESSQAIFSNKSFRLTSAYLLSSEQMQDIDSVFKKDPAYARTAFHRLFDFLSSPVMTNFFNDKYSNEFALHISQIYVLIMTYICTAIENIIFKKDDLKNQIPTIFLLFEYADKKKQYWEQSDMHKALYYTLVCVCALANETVLVPNMIEAKAAEYCLKWISMNDASLYFQNLTLSIMHNIARHELGANVLNDSNCINILKEFHQRIIKPNQDKIDDEVHAQIRLVYCMTMSLLVEPKENQEDLNNLRQPLDQLMQAAIDCGQSINNKSNGFHVSEPIVVLTKLFVHDDVLKYVLTESSIKNMQAKSRLQFFCDLLIKFRGALASDNDLDQLSLTALFNILWSISFHREFVEELKSYNKFLLTVKSLANDDGKDWVDQYVPKHMSAIPKAANGILWNLKEQNPARASRIATVSKESKLSDTNVSTPGQIRVMISYSHADSEFCHRLVEALEKDNRLKLWVDFAFCHTEDLWEEIALAIEESQVILFLMSKDYQDSKSCRQEVIYAKDSQKKRFIPIYIKKEFIATGWLGIRIAGPQYIRFEKRPFDDTIRELNNLIIEDKTRQESGKNTGTEPTLKPSPSTGKQPPNDNTSNGKLLKKSIAKWTKTDIRQWFDNNGIHKELSDLYDFQSGTDIVLYGRCLQPDWQIEYNAMSERYVEKYGKKLYRDQFVVLVGAIHRLETSNSKLCNIS